MNKDVEAVKVKINDIIGRRMVATKALCLYYAAIALKEFRSRQSNNEFWTDRTRTAHNTVFANVVDEQNFAGFFLAHAVEYGVFLELANSRKHEALRPIVFELEGSFLKDLEEIWK